MNKEEFLNYIKLTITKNKQKGNKNSTIKSTNKNKSLFESALFSMDTRN